MKINLNDRITFGIDVQTKRRGKIVNRELQTLGTSESIDEFTALAQYILDAAPNTARFVIWHRPTDMIISFDGLIRNTLHMKSNRYKEA